MEGQRILFAILDWGLGHATRSAPLIDNLLTQGYEVIIAGNGHSLTWLKNTFPKLTTLGKPHAEMRYSKHLNALMIAMQTPRFVRNIERERKWIHAVVKEHAITQVYSDNCYGVRHDTVKSVLITHQLNLPVPRPFRKVLNARIHKLVRAFDEVLVPDDEGEQNLSGSLGHGEFDFPVKYIGPQSHFTLVDEAEVRAVPVVGMVSGPEPHRSDFEKQLLDDFTASGREAIIFGGQPGKGERQEGKVRIYADAPAAMIKAHLLKAEQVVCRSGYSTIMDLHLLGVRNARYVPTPGQWEQQYLARRFNTMAQA